jgi:predicted MFS family arabinose efflux permease
VRRRFRRAGLLLVRWLVGVAAGALLGGALQLATGVAGWALVGAALGFVSVVFWLTLRDPRG